jgi:hypothetical protein
MARVKVRGRSLAALVAVAGFAALLQGCASDGMLMNPSGSSMPQPPPGPTVTADQLVGRWGLASYREDKDKPRTQNEARAQCANPYVIAKGPNGGVMMHLADEKEPRELIVKTAGGRTFVGPDGTPPGDVFDREIVAFTGDTMTMAWMDPEVAGRYGTFIYVRCGAPGGAKPAAAKPAPAKPAGAKT